MKIEKTKESPDLQGLQVQILQSTSLSHIHLPLGTETPEHLAHRCKRRGKEPGRSPLSASLALPLYKRVPKREVRYALLGDVIFGEEPWWFGVMVSSCGAWVCFPSAVWG